MIPLIFEYVRASQPARALIGANPVRFWPFASAPQPGEASYRVPYAVWRLVSGTAQDYLSDLPDTDSSMIQIDAWAETPSDARVLMLVLRDAIEPHQNGGSTTYNGEDRDPDTGMYRWSFNVEFWQDRQSN